MIIFFSIAYSIPKEIKYAVAGLRLKQFNTITTDEITNFLTTYIVFTVLMSYHDLRQF